MSEIACDMHCHSKPVTLNMSRGIIGRAPSYTSTSSQMSAAVGSVASMIAESHRMNEHKETGTFLAARQSLPTPDPSFQVSMPKIEEHVWHAPVHHSQLQMKEYSDGLDRMRRDDLDRIRASSWSAPKDMYWGKAWDLPWNK